jgi:outer membrane protein insertion porin family
MYKILKIIFLAIFFQVYLSANSYLYAKINLEINGNKKISEQTINQIINFDKNKIYTENELNNIYKKLFETNFFEKIDLRFDNNLLKIDLKENPIINFFYIDGESNKKITDLIYEKIDLSQNAIYSENLLNSDIKRITEIYKDLGFFNTKINPQISRLNENEINIILKISKGKKYKINKIFFIGNNSISSSVLKSAIFSSEYGWWKFLSPSTGINEKQIDYDKNLLKKFYLNNGFYDVQIISTDIEFNEQGNANLVISLNEGKKYFLNNFELIDNNNNLNKEQIKFIKNIMNKYVSEIYAINKLSKIKKEVNDFLNSNKIEFVDVELQEEKIFENQIKINAILLNKDKKFVNLINITGNSITEEEVIRRSLFFAEGDSFASYKLSQSQRELENLGLFKNIKFEVDKNTNGNDLVNVNITVEEQPTGEISAGVGLGSHSSSIITGLNEKNFLGKGINLNFNTSLGTEKIQGTVSATFPDFRNTNNALISEIFAVSSDFENAGYESTKVGSNIATQYEIFENVDLRLGTGIDLDDISANSSASNLYKSMEGKYTTFKGFYSVINDKRNRSFMPSEGHNLSFGQVLALPGSDIPYLENNLRGAYYYPLNENYIFNVKSSFNSINSLNNKDVKLSDRQFSTNREMRGFENRGIGPKDGKDHVGGNYSAFASISSTFPNYLPEKWNANSSVFLDAGNVWGVDFNESLDSDRIRSSFGVSFDWVSPLGPLNFTFSETLSSANGDKEESFSFNIGSVF